ncbi:hypothetical protein FA15DRAFT_666803 [Coprinopsis marcescibilis]|uniref:IMD domain-containing protein n=1 Tax=Coprinopsis marcescibilis TaxID=230819 RepID=A0A5C3L246_COPMA|nr:hypothetical protein FA15DRAFT_666803 [Coprinopsis marcescibilis]
MAPNRPQSLRTFTLSSVKRALSPGPPSPTFSEVTNASAMHFGPNGPTKIITRANLKASINAYEDLVNSCSSYRAALVAMSRATAAFADAMERCSGLKGPTYEAGTRLQAASGLHHLMGNLWHVLSDSLDTKVEKPLRQLLETYRTTVNDRSQAHEHVLKEKSQAIRDTEMRSLNRKQRNLQSFREALSMLQRQVDDLDEFKASYYQDVVDHEEDVWNGVQGKVCLAVRSTMDVFDRVTSKASDPIIEHMLQTVPDPFDSYGPPQSEDQIFSILAPLSIMSPSPSPSPVVGTPEQGQLGTSPLSHPKITSWLPSASNGVYPVETTDWASASGSTSPVSPASPPPTSTSPPCATTPTNRRHSVPPSSGRKAESKLRSVLAPIEELRPCQDLGSASTNRRLSNPLSISADQGGSRESPPSEETMNSAENWGGSYGASQYEPDDDGATTPRRSTLFSHSDSFTQLDDKTPPTHDLEQEKEKNGFGSMYPEIPAT